MELAYKRDSVYEVLNDILDKQAIRTVYQPIIDLTNGSILGYEALSRGPRGSVLESPGFLFETADKYNRLWELELLCRTKALENAYNLPKAKLIFINVNPEVIKDPRYKKGMTKEYIERYGINPTKIIFEITEKTAVSDYKSFRKALDNYISQGYKIALDDTGAGYSGLRLLAETHPQYIKIDMELVRDIDKDIIKQELMKTFCEFAKIANMKLIAEGIETTNELNTLIDIGVAYGQGYLIHKPAEGFVEPAAGIICSIQQRYHQKKLFLEKQSFEINIGQITRFDDSLPVNSTLFDVYERFKAEEHLQGIVITDHEVPIGLVMRQKLDIYIASNQAVQQWQGVPIDRIMEQNPLILERSIDIKATCRKAIARREENIYDYIIVVENGKFYGVVPIGILLNTINELK